MATHSLAGSHRRLANGQTVVLLTHPYDRFDLMVIIILLQSPTRPTFPTSPNAFPSNALLQRKQAAARPLRGLASTFSQFMARNYVVPLSAKIPVS
jgi:hypothetical protein